MLLVFSFAGCNKESSSIALQFYYPLENYGYDPVEEKFYSQSIDAEIREDIHYISARQVLGEYLKGPIDPAMMNPFPAELELLDLNIDSNVLYIVLSDELAELSGISLTVACSCLANTAMKLTSISAVNIQCKNQLLDGKKSLTFTANTAFFKDIIINNES
jgi:hypothetical protein